MRHDLDKAWVYIVDDEESVRDALAWLMRVEGLETKVFDSAEGFLKICSPHMRGCVLLDIRLPGLSGLEAQQLLETMGVAIPIIFVTGHGDVPMSRQAFRSGALDFIEKPFKDEELLARIREALEIDASRNRLQHTQVDKLERFNRLSRREKEILQLVITGKSSKVIAKELCISNRTVEVHRAHIMEKMQVDSLTQLVALGYDLNLIDARVSKSLHE